MPQTEAFSRTIIDAQLRDQDWNLTDGKSVRFECVLSDGKRTDYLLCDRSWRGLAIIEAKRSIINAAEAAEQVLRLGWQTGDAFVEGLRDHPCHILQAGKSFQHEKRITRLSLLDPLRT